jgi:hypothetical protein
VNRFCFPFFVVLEHLSKSLPNNKKKFIQKEKKINNTLRPNKNVKEMRSGIYNNHRIKEIAPPVTTSRRLQLKKLIRPATTRTTRLKTLSNFVSSAPST